MQRAGGPGGDAARLLAAAEAMRVTIGTVIAPCDNAQHDATTAGTRAALGDEAFTAAWQQGLRARIEDLQTDLASPGAAASSVAARQSAARPDMPTGLR